MILFFVATQFAHGQIDKRDNTVNTLKLNNDDRLFQEKMFEAISQRGIENYEKAIDILQQILNQKDINNQNAAVYFQLGLNYFDIERYDFSITNLEKALDLQPDDKDILTTLLEVYELHKKYDKAIEVAVELSKADASYHERLAHIYLMTNQYQKALLSLDNADNQLGFNYFKDKLREEIYKAYNQPELAIQYYKNRIFVEPYHPTNYYNLVTFLMLNNQYNDAILSIEEALKKHPQFSKFYVQKVNAYTTQEDPKKAFKALEQVVLDRFLEEKYKVKAIEMMKSYVQKNPEYQEDFLQILNIASDTAQNTSSDLDLGYYYFDTNKPMALTSFQKALKQNPQDFKIWQNISILQYQLKEYKDVIITVDEAIEIYPTQAIFKIIKGQSLLQLTQYNEAEKVLLDALDYLFEENEMMQNLYQNLSKVYENLNQPETANNYQIKADKLKLKLKQSK